MPSFDRMLQSLVCYKEKWIRINIQPTTSKGSWVKLEPLNESHKNKKWGVKNRC
jgi:hypothetical protein